MVKYWYIKNNALKVSIQSNKLSKLEILKKLALLMITLSILTVSIIEIIPDNIKALIISIIKNIIH